MSKIKAGLILKVKFVLPESNKYQEYINYIDRENAIRNDNIDKYNLYNNYMGNPEKSSGLFTSTKDNLNKNEIENLKKSFEKAQKNNSVMWQNVISFDNRWLAELGVYNLKTKELNEKALQSLTRKAMNEMLEKEKIKGSAIWSASIHYNTDNIHVHIAVVEPNPTRKAVKEQGKIKVTTFNKMKSKAVNEILDMSRQYEKINTLIREDIIKNREEKLFSKDKELTQLFKEIHSKLPKNKRMWQYNMSALHEVRPLIDKLSTVYINTYHKKEYDELIKRINYQQEQYKKAYGVGKNELYNNLMYNKVKDLYTRMGNSILKELKEYDKDLRQKELKKFNLSYDTRLSISRLKRSLYSDYSKLKNEYEYERLQREIEYEI